MTEDRAWGKGYRKGIFGLLPMERKGDCFDKEKTEYGA